MKRPNLSRDQNLHLQFKEYKRRRKRHGAGIKTRHSLKYFPQRGTIRQYYSVFLREMEKRGFIKEEYVQEKIVIPNSFSFKENYNGSITTIKNYLSSFIFGKGDVVLDFSNCLNTDVSIFSFLHVCSNEIFSFRERYNDTLFHKVTKWVKCIASEKDGRTNRYLNAFGYQELEDKFKDGTLFLPLKLISGKGKGTYSENPKSVACKKVADFINTSGEPFGVSLTPDSRNALEGFVSEVLNNAEDHSLRNSEWYVNGISFNFNKNDTEVVEVNLAIINIGLSMYDGFEETKVKNISIYNKLDSLYEEHKRQFSLLRHFEREQLFMLYMLNEGISRLKYEDSSRGNGTMNFIESFISLGSFGDENTNFSPKLNVISGHTVLTCDNKYKPFVNKTLHQISLNRDQDIHKLPDNDYLSYAQESFPGTILEAKIYLNKEHILKQIQVSENE